MISPTLLERLATARRIVFFTGAGISAESGVPTFRSNDGLWERFKPEELASIAAFLDNPQTVWTWYQARRDIILAAFPNPGHTAIAAMGHLLPCVTVITQNIDGLHLKAGSSEVLELHGNIRRNFCQSCGRHYDDESFLTVEEVQGCDCGGKIRPDVVWFGEMLPSETFASAEQRAIEASVFFCVGTSALVYPAAELPALAREYGAYLVEINPETTPLSSIMHETVAMKSGEAIPAILDALHKRLGPL